MNGRTHPATPAAEALAAVATGPMSAPTWARIAELAGTLRDPVAGNGRDAVLAAIERAARVLLSPNGREHDFIFARETFWLPFWLAARTGPLVTRDYWVGKRARMIEYLARPLDDKTLGHVLTSVLICEGVLEGRGAALARLIGRILEHGPERVKRGLPLAAEAYGALLADARWFDEAPPLLVHALVDAEGKLAALPAPSFAAWSLLVVSMFLAPGAPEDFRAVIFHSAVLPVIDQASRRPGPQMLAIAAAVDLAISRNHLRAGEGTERFGRIAGAAAKALSQVGRSAKDSGLAGADIEYRPSHRAVRVAFVVHSLALLAHTATLATFLRGLGALPDRPIEPFVYIVSEGSPEAAFNAAITERTAATRSLPAGSVHPALWLRETAARDGVAAVVFVSSVTYLGFAAGLGVAPLLIWWSMKYHRLEVDGVDDYLAAGNFFDETVVHGERTWRACRVALPPLRAESADADGRRLRRELGAADDDLVLACIGREEKMISPGYIAALARIMAACPGARFVWTGRSNRVREVAALLQVHGIAARCHFLGWLADTRVAAAAMDVFLDSFPFASGFTAFEAMAAGKPIVVLKTPESLESSTASVTVPVLEGRAGTAVDQAAVRGLFTGADGALLTPFADSIEDYIDLGIRLGRDAALRAQLGAACRAYVERFTRDEVAFARTTCKHLVEIVQAKAAAAGGVIRY
jgi:glycosyltransferase involved in cell wall biosynthesis